jgi:hypothetical protein
MSIPAERCGKSLITYLARVRWVGINYQTPGTP